MKFPRIRVMSVCLLCFSLLACTSRELLTRDELVEHNQETLAQLADQQVPSARTWTLSEALQHTLTHNADFRVAALQTAIATGDHRIANLDLLPGLVARAGYSRRSNDLASSSQSVLTGTQSLSESTSSDRSRDTSSVTLSWDVMDFALALFRAREAGDEYRIALEQRRRVQQNLTADLVHAWWSAWAYQSLKPEIDQLRGQIDEALAQSDIIIRRRLQDPLRVIEYRKALFYVLKRLDSLTLELEQARLELARLMNLPPEMALTLSGGEELIALADQSRLPDLSLQFWQLAALMNRPEVRITLYEGRIGVSQRRRAVWQLMPSLGISYGTNYDSNSFLVNNRWQETGINASLELLKLASYPARRRNLAFSRQLAEIQQQAVATAVVSQMAVSEKSYRQNQRSWCMSAQLADLDNQRTSLLEAQSAASSLDNLSLIRARLENLLLRTEVALDFATLQRDRIQVLVSAGLLDMPALSGEQSEKPDLSQWLYRDVTDYVKAEIQTLSSEFELTLEGSIEQGGAQCQPD